MGNARGKRNEQAANQDTSWGNKWKDVLLLGEKLIPPNLCLALTGDPRSETELIQEQCKLIVAASEDMFGGQAAIWISDSLLNKTNKSLEIFSPEPTSTLMQQVCETGQMCYQITQEGKNLDSDEEFISVGVPDKNLTNGIAAPILLDEGSQGGNAVVKAVLSVQGQEGRLFDATDLELFEGLLLQSRLGLNIGLNHLLSENRFFQYNTLFDVSKAITSILDQDQLLDEVSDLIQNRFGYPYVHLFSVHTGRRQIIYETGSGKQSRELWQEHQFIDLDDPQGIIPWVGRNGQTVLLNDVSKDPRFRPNPYPPQETLSELTIPLIFAGKVLGILDIQSDQLGVFSEEDRQILEALADNIAIALRNAYLYRSESWRRQVSESLREVAGLLSADVNLEQVLDAILVELERNLPCDLATIWLVEEEETSVDPGGNGLPLRLAAAHGIGALVMDLEIGTRLDEVVQSEKQFPYGIGDALNASWLMAAFDSDMPVIRFKQLDQVDEGSAIAMRGDYSAIAAPLRVGTQKLGVLTLFHHTGGRYGREARSMTAAFASYAAVAIENTRLYEVAHEQAWISTVMLQVADATQMLTDLDDLLETVVRLTPTVAGVRICLLYLLVDASEFVPAAASGLSQAQRDEFMRWRFELNDVPALQRIMDEKSPTILDEGTDDWRMASVLYVGMEIDDIFTDEVYILIPLVAHGDVIGSFLISYRVNLFEKEEHQAMNLFFDQKLPIIQGIAHQTAVSVEISRLLRAQKEEAYVSVALLQVAQTIVSMTELDEILEAIVRIIPILVNVTRSVIYLYDSRSGIYHLAQEYGLPRESEGALFVHGEFPLLDSVRENKSVLAVPAIGNWDESEDIHDAWTHIRPTDFEEAKSYLESEQALILAFPLSVQEEVLGILIVEEPEPTPVNVLLGEISYLSLREKRLEIMTGISQLSSLAIQNYYLQQEMVDRERLERELQLAREIQMTFLPTVPPEFPGWDMSMDWQPAREVGGDFYDYFDLPGNRFGLVIADVADKGMPAALYMTLIRTLIRATAQEYLAPSDVLKRINNIMLENAEQGMFVTLFYAVLSQDSGQILYTNAGHVPPYLVHIESGKLEMLIRGGMALGVIGDYHIEEREVALEVGDYLILYTDGFTDAVSIQDEIFGEDRFTRVIEDTIPTLKDPQQSKADLSAQSAVAEIERKIKDFMNGAPLADDLTLVVIKRLGRN